MKTFVAILLVPVSAAVAYFTYCIVRGAVWGWRHCDSTPEELKTAANKIARFKG